MPTCVWFWETASTVFFSSQWETVSLEFWPSNLFSALWESEISTLIGRTMVVEDRRRHHIIFRSACLDYVDHGLCLTKRRLPDRILGWAGGLAIESQRLPAKKRQGPSSF